MFDNLKGKTTPVKSSENPSGSINIIAAGTSIEGEIKSNGDLRIDGNINGSVFSKAKVVIGATGVVEGDIVCQNADVSGTIKGTSTVTEMLFLKSTAKINGDINTGKLVVEVGASFTGNCNMGPMVKDIKNVERAETKLQEKTA
ncbi:MAG TPA: polymer-forming cytoskeletal protein [Bacteroidia bacterium]|nr:MAG: Integral membrane protein CcmA involved in cell shape determination [Bacteroidetes bacterium OLB10]MBE7510905.1 polymer-forming cytoskeletal protein [Bacteroidia bacterium]MBX3106550.1 polymer-forming cytoskeletal protein [Bacteroidota bacterium]MCE7955599.1 polymer-forming cytoskeletal protein [Bacteroidetes bacterium CHB6]OQB62042.1 MAG: Polymer-forming cytoskeletal [Bacteroidetes bacterium ADurb.Bin141]